MKKLTLRVNQTRLLKATPKLVLRYKDLNHGIAVVVINLMR